MFEIEANKEAWGLLSKDHYLHFKRCLEDTNFKLNPIITRELGDVSGKKILHLQCNTGADSILLARMGAVVTGVDLVPDNVYYAKELAKDFNISNIDFIESDIMTLMEKHNEKYDIVFTSDGAIGWLPDLKKWAQTIKYFLKDDGYFYLHDSHPLFLVFDEEEISQGNLLVKYPYFKNHVEKDSFIGGYASEVKESDNYYWAYKFSDVINGLSSAGLFIESISEHDRCAEGMGGAAKDDKGLCYYPGFEGKLPITFSLKATIR
jgi:SAM-dependent methyltransferase